MFKPLPPGPLGRLAPVYVGVAHPPFQQADADGFGRGVHHQHRPGRHHPVRRRRYLDRHGSVGVTFDLCLHPGADVGMGDVHQFGELAGIGEDDLAQAGPGDLPIPRPPPATGQPPAGRLHRQVPGPRGPGDRRRSITTPRSASREQTRLLPEPMPPVTTTRGGVRVIGRSGRTISLRCPAS